MGFHGRECLFKFLRRPFAKTFPATMTRLAEDICICICYLYLYFSQKNSALIQVQYCKSAYKVDAFTPAVAYSSQPTMYQKQLFAHISLIIVRATLMIEGRSKAHRKIERVWIHANAKRSGAVSGPRHDLPVGRGSAIRRSIRELGEKGGCTLEYSRSFA